MTGLSENSENNDETGSNTFAFGTVTVSRRRSEKRPTVEHICRSVEGVYDAPSETNFKTKASKQGPAGIGGRWIITVTRKRRVRSPEWAGGYANLKDRN
jgi:hypothetical protein